MIRNSGGSPLPNADNTYLSTVTWPKIAAHRMTTSKFGENTIQSGLVQLAAGIKVLDSDLWLTSDGHPVLMHDDTVDRTTDGTGRIDAFTAAQIAALRVNYTSEWAPLTGKPQKVPVLTDLAIFKGRAIITVEHKTGPDASVVPALAASLAGMEDSMLIQCFWGTSRDAWHAAGFKVAVMSLPTADLATYYDLGFRWVGYAFTGTGTDPEKAQIDAAKAAGMKVLTWTHGNQEQVSAALTAGSDMPIADYPNEKGIHV